MTSLAFHPQLNFLFLSLSYIADFLTTRPSFSITEHMTHIWVRGRSMLAGVWGLVTLEGHWSWGIFRPILATGSRGYAKDNARWGRPTGHALSPIVA